MRVSAMFKFIEGLAAIFTRPIKVFWGSEKNQLHADIGPDNEPDKAFQRQMMHATTSSMHDAARTSQRRRFRKFKNN